MSGLGAGHAVQFDFASCQRLSVVFRHLGAPPAVADSLTIFRNVWGQENELAARGARCNPQPEFVPASLPQGDFVFYEGHDCQPSDSCCGRPAINAQPVR